MGDAIMHPLRHRVLVQVVHVAVKGRGADEGVDARIFRVFHGLPTAVDILKIGPRQPADDGVFRVFRDLADGCEIPFRGDREPGLDDIDAHFVEQGRDLQLLGMAHGGAGALFAVAQGGVENHHSVLVGCHGVCPWS